ncbi:tetratricopeptide (TPR) repeat protein [Sinomonas sp. RB5]
MGSVLEQSTLDALWDFSDPAASEAAFRRALEDPQFDAAERCELATQLGRAIGLQGRFEEADALLDGIDCEPDPTIGVRVVLERGRLLNSSGHAAMAVPLFEQAAELGEHLGEEFLAADAFHMLAIADTEHAESWARAGIEYASSSHSPRTQRWCASLHGNLGWMFVDAGEPHRALVEFQLAEQWAERVGTPAQVEWAREGIAACRATGG